MDAVDHSGGAIMVKKLDTTSKKKQKGPVLNGFQLFDMDQLNEINKKEEALFGGKKSGTKFNCNCKVASRGHCGTNGMGKDH